jgi:hypothetical protein
MANSAAVVRSASASSGMTPSRPTEQIGAMRSRHCGCVTPEWLTALAFALAQELVTRSRKSPSAARPSSSSRLQSGRFRRNIRLQSKSAFSSLPLVRKANFEAGKGRFGPFVKPSRNDRNVRIPAGGNRREADIAEHHSGHECAPGAPIGKLRTSPVHRDKARYPLLLRR